MIHVCVCAAVVAGDVRPEGDVTRDISRDRAPVETSTDCSFHGDGDSSHGNDSGGIIELAGPQGSGDSDDNTGEHARDVDDLSDSMVDAGGPEMKRESDSSSEDDTEELQRNAGDSDALAPLTETLTSVMSSRVEEMDGLDDDDVNRMHDSTTDQVRFSALERVAETVGSETQFEIFVHW